LPHSSLQRVDRELRAGLELMPPYELTPEVLPAIREQMDAVAAMPVEDAYEVECEIRRAPAADGRAVEIVLYRPRHATGRLPAVLEIHGGGFIMGSARMSAALNRQRAAEAGCLVACVDYRLAPETRHPGPLEDCYAALAWLHREAEALDLDPGRVGVLGQSAGGGLAAALALLARDRGEHRLAFQHLIYPMLDDRTVLKDAVDGRGEFVWTPAANRFGWAALLGAEPGGPEISAYAAPARAQDLAKLPPAFMYVGGLDLFLEEDLDYARRLMAAGVPVELHVYPGAYHGFEVAVGARLVAQAQRDSLDALKRALHPQAG
jgi:triacylglycerol lipase